ncbi:MAG TPA: Bax inhibitor-1/YccA family protein [Acidimicrobiales bacterium]|nr:Bax inhibitor-1/YccA family protein [Acidimicrobiales bacterium]
MRTTNPALNDKIFNRQIEEARTAGAGGRAARPPVDDQVSPWTPPESYETMTVNGTISAAAVLLVLLLAAGWAGWAQVDVSPEGVRFPGWLLPTMLVGLGIAIVTVIKPKLARFTAPVYALVEGLLLGAISHLYNLRFDGIVVQAVGLTLGVFVIMLGLYATRVIKVTDKLRTGIIVATGAVFLVYMVSLVARLFGADLPFIHDTGTVGILFSLAVVVIASLNLLLDFDFIEQGSQRGAPKYMEWYGAFGLMVTLVWLYLELLRFMSKLRGR